MGELGGFMKIHRVHGRKRPVPERLRDFKEYVFPAEDPVLREQGARCMDCGIPFCHNGCPLGNLIPDWNDLVYRDRWREAIEALHATNNFPEFTGRICPAPCEAACVLDINDDAVTIKQIEQSIADRAWDEEWVKPAPPAVRSGKSVAVVGSGPAGLAAAQELNRFGHEVTLFERNTHAGGLLRFGVPDFKLEKWIVQRRVDQMVAEGVEVRCGVNVGVDVTGDELRDRYDAVVVAIGSTIPRDLPVPGRELDGVHFAMDYLEMRNRWVAGEYRDGTPITAAGKHVVIIGGGDTGADCLGTAHRQGAASVTQLEIMPQPPESRHESTPWPTWPLLHRTSSAHEEGGERVFAVSTERFVGSEGSVRGLLLHEVAMAGGRFEKVPGTERELPADLVFLAMGFTGVEQGPLLTELGVDVDARGNIVRDSGWHTTAPDVFVAGDAGRGQSLIVWAIAEGRAAAAAVDAHLTGDSSLPAPVQPTSRPLVAR